LPGFVGQKEWRHRLADLRCRLARPISTKPRYEPIHCSGKFRSIPPYCLSKGAKLVAQRYVQIAHAPEGIAQALPLDIRDHGKISPQAFAVPNLEPSAIILQKSDMLWISLSICIVVPLNLEGVDRAGLSSADSHRAVNNGRPDCENIDWLSSR
jgi:hypothetical protein